VCQSVGGELRQLAHLLVASLKAAGMRCETLRLPGPFSPTASISESCWVLFSALDTSCHSSSRMAWGHRAYPPGACAYKCVDNDPLTALISNGWGETAHVEQWCTFGLCAQRRACVCVCAQNLPPPDFKHKHTCRCSLCSGRQTMATAQKVAGTVFAWEAQRSASSRCGANLSLKPALQAQSDQWKAHFCFICTHQQERS